MISQKNCQEYVSVSYEFLTEEQDAKKMFEDITNMKFIVDVNDKQNKMAHIQLSRNHQCNCIFGGCSLCGANGAFTLFK